MPEQKPKYTLEIFSPLKGKGLNRKYTASDIVENEENYIELGLIVTDEKGEVVKDMTVTVEATDSQQNKTLEGTGTVIPIYPNGKKKVVHYYHFHYEFKTAGKHTITFTADGKKEQVNLDYVEAKKKE